MHAPLTEVEAPAPVRPAGRSRRELLRFLAVGGTNTLVTTALFVLLQLWLAAPIAYTAVFALGLAYTTGMTATVVFGSRLRWRTGGVFVAGYLCVYLVGLGVVHLLEAAWAPSPLTTSVVVVLVTAPLNFLVGRLVFGGEPHTQAAAQSEGAGTPPTG